MADETRKQLGEGSGEGTAPKVAVSSGDVKPVEEADGEYVRFF